jgi:Zn-dependent M16 (insulinase) family peptidase
MGLNILADFVLERDRTPLLQQCIEAEDVPFAILSGISDNQVKRLHAAGRFDGEAAGPA